MIKKCICISSLAAILLVVVLALTSLNRPLYFDWYSKHSLACLSIVDGDAAIILAQDDSDYMIENSANIYRQVHKPDRAKNGAFYWYYSSVGPELQMQMVCHSSPTTLLSASTPLWAPALLLAVFPSVVFVCGPLKRRRRLKRNQCLNCAYDLSGNTSGTCPECGNEI